MLQITLFDENGNELLYQAEQIFSVNGTDQLYCGAVPVGGGDIIFLKCDLTEQGENVEVAVSDISDTAEYARVAAAYAAKATQVAVREVSEKLDEGEECISVTDAEGNKVNFIVHTVFEDSVNHREYIAVQRVDGEGEIFEEISLYRFFGDGEKPEMEMIPSDMEYERARSLFLNLIENS